jgi:sporulation and cell division protein SsgA
MSEFIDDRSGEEESKPHGVSQKVLMRLIIPEQTIAPIESTASYTDTDPYAVTLAFDVGLEEPIEWIVARDLLAGGAIAEEGLGDFRVWPSASASADNEASVLHIDLSSPEGQAHFEAPADEIAKFLQRTYEIVPAGSEMEHVDVDAELSDLLRQA